MSEKKTFTVGDEIFAKVKKMSGKIVAVDYKGANRETAVFDVELENGETRHFTREELEQD